MWGGRRGEGDWGKSGGMISGDFKVISYHISISRTLTVHNLTLSGGGGRVGEA